MPNTELDALLDQARLALEQQRWPRAEQILNQAVRFAPEHAEVLRLCGLADYFQGRFAAAIPKFSKVVAGLPSDAAAWHVMAACHSALAQPDAARQALTQALAADADHRESLNDLGDLLRRTGQLAEAETVLRRACIRYPEYALVSYNLGLTLLDQGRFAESRQYLAQASQHDPNHADIWHNLGVVDLELGEFDQASDALKKALQLNPRHVVANFDLSRIHYYRAEWVQAAQYLKAALAESPDFPEALCNLAIVSMQLHDFDTCIRTSRHIVACGCALGYPVAYSAARTLCLWDLAATLQPILLQKIQAGELTPLQCASVIMVLLAPENIDNATHLKLNRTVGALYESVATAPYDDYPKAMADCRKLRIGYLSPDFYNHVVSSFIRGLINFYDTSRFEVYCYSNTQKPDSVTEQYVLSVDRFVDVRHLSDEQIAQRIHDDGVHILIDLAGYTSHTRLGVLPYRPAPIQISYLGYPYSLGLGCIDYILADPYLAGEKYAEYCVETPLLLPESAFCFGDFLMQRIHAVPAFVRHGQVTFGSLINPYKLNPHTIAVWSRILQRTPGSVIKFIHFYLAHELTQQNLRAEFAKHGIAPERVVITSERYPGDGIHLNYYNDFDISLDTFPMTGGVTSMESMWMGTPMVTLVGDAHSERISYSLIKNIPLALDDLVAFSEDEYVDKAVALAGNTARIAELLVAIPTALRHSVLTDPVQFAKHMEATYVAGWNRKFPNHAVAPISTRKPVEMVPGPSGIEFAVPESLDDAVGYIVREYQGWYDQEYAFVQNLVQPGEGALDIAASYGMYIAPLARQAGVGRCRAIVTPGKNFSFLDLTKTHNALDNLSIVAYPNHELVPGGTGDWAHLSLVRLGHEVHAVPDGIVKRCDEYWNQFDPVVLVPLRNDARLDLSIATQLQARDFRLYRLIPGLDLLAPCTDDVLDAFALNVFAIKDSRARLLQQRGLLVAQVESVMQLPQAGDSGYVDFLSQRPFAGIFQEVWVKEVDSWSDIYRMALNLYAQAQDRDQRPPGQRLAALDGACKMLLTLCTAQATFPRMLTLCRILMDLGHREQAFNIISQLVTTIESGGNVDVEEPFLPLQPGFEQFQIDAGSFPTWMLSQLYETRERLRSFSSFFTPDETLAVLEALADSPYLSADMARRLALLRRRNHS